MIKSFLELNENEKILALEFIKENENSDLSLEQIQKEVLGKICNYGEGVLFYLDEDEIKGKISVILEVANKLKTIYINKVICSTFDKKVLQGLIDEAHVLANKYKAKKVLLGIRNEGLLNLCGQLELKKAYSSFNMVLNNRGKISDVLDKVKLSNKNDNEDYFIVLYKNEKIGFLNTTINDTKAFFDIGLIKEYRGKGYGKKILETAIQFLTEKQVEEICLTVIEKNNIAYEMYKKRGFEVYNKLSDWIELI